MSGFIRPELTQFFRRWREPIAAGVLAVIGAYFLWRGFVRYNSVLEIIGLVLLLIGLALVWTAYRRAQFNRTGRGPGLIEVTERRITYLSSQGGDSVDIAAMTRLEMRSTIEFGRVWVLKQSEGPSLYIPVSAAGSEALFDAFSALPGMETAKLIAALDTTGDQRTVIWRGSPRFRALT